MRRSPRGSCRARSMMDMVVVERVRARAEHGREVAAGADEDLAQELLLGRVRAAPALDDGDLAAVGEDESHHVERVAEGVLGEPGAALVVARPAGIGAGLARRRPARRNRGGRRLHHLVEPGFDARDDRAGESHRRGEADAAVGEGRDLERVVHAAGAGPVDRRHPRHIGGGLHELARQAGLLGLRCAKARAARSGTARTRRARVR